MYLIDTSVWIDFLRGTATPRVNLLEGLLDEGDAYLCDITLAEICYGARDDRQLEKYLRYFTPLPFLSLPNGWHIQLAHMGFRLRKHGHAPFTGDLLIALAALTHGASLLTNDADFAPYTTLFGLRVD